MFIFGRDTGFLCEEATFDGILELEFNFKGERRSDNNSDKFEYWGDLLESLLDFGIVNPFVLGFVFEKLIFGIENVGFEVLSSLILLSLFASFLVKLILGIANLGVTDCALSKPYLPKCPNKKQNIKKENKKR